MADELIRLDKTIVGIDVLITKAETAAEANALFKAKDVIYSQQRYFADVQPVKKSKWCPPLMGQGKCDTYCERCHGKIMRNSTGIFEETPFCPHCGARMDGAETGKGYER